MKKKIIGFLFVAIIIVMNITVGATEVPKLTSSAYLSEENNTIEMTINISENTKICGCSFTIIYDNTKLKFNSYAANDIIKNTSLIVNDKYAENSIRVAWAAVEELTASGEVIKIKFDLIDGASGTTELQIDKLKMVDVNGSKIESSSENVIVLISEDAVTDESEGSTGDTSTENDSTSSGNVSAGGSTSSGGGSYKPKPNENKNDNNEEVKEPLPETPSDSDELEEDYEVFLLGFRDVKETDWFYEGVKFVKSSNLMSGISDTEFAPISKLTRAMLVTILYRIEAMPECGEPKFTDVESDQWYSNGVAWAAENKIVNGVGNGEFAPHSDITREQIAVILYNYSNMHNLDTTQKDNLEKYSDNYLVSKWASDAMEWAVGTELLSGKGNGILDPKGSATRGEIATILMRYINKYSSYQS